MVGGYAYILDCFGFLHTAGVSDPTNPKPLGSIKVSNNAYSLFVLGNYAYVANFGGGFKIVDVSNPKNPQMAGSLKDANKGAMPDNPNSVVVAGAYAYVAGDNVLQIVNVKDPANPYSVGWLKHNQNGAKLKGAYKVVVDKAQRYAYVVSVGSNALQIVDIQNPAFPTPAGSLNLGSYTGSVDDYDLSIAVSGDYAYVTRDGVSSADDALDIIDVKNPNNPKLISTLKHREGGALLAGAYKVVVVGDYAYVASVDSQALEIVNVSDRTKPKHHASLRNGKMNALLYTPCFIAVVGEHAFILDGGFMALQIVKLTEPGASPR